MGESTRSVQEHRARRRAEKEKEGVLFEDLSPWMQDRLVKDMRLTVHPTKKGTIIVTWDMSKDTDEFLREYAKGLDMAFDELMGHLNREILRRVEQQRTTRYLMNPIVG